MNQEISICIPTYNREARLDKSLNMTSKAIGSKKNIDLYISDNASTDATHDIIDKYQKMGVSIHYSCNEKNLGFKTNFIKALDMPKKSQYCWLMGDDDYVLEEGFSQLMSYLEKNAEEEYDLIIVNGQCGSEPGLKHTCLIEDRDTVLANLGGQMSWMSSIIFSRNFLNEKHILKKMDACKHAFPHIDAIFASLEKKCKVLWFNEEVIRAIGGTPSYFDKVYEYFIRDWYLVVADKKELYSKDAIDRYLDNTSINTRFILTSKLNGLDMKKNRSVFTQYAMKYPRRKTWLSAYYLAYIVPKRVLEDAKSLYHKVK